MNELIKKGAKDPTRFLLQGIWLQNLVSSVTIKKRLENNSFSKHKLVKKTTCRNYVSVKAPNIQSTNLSWRVCKYSQNIMRFMG